MLSIPYFFDNLIIEELPVELFLDYALLYLKNNNIKLNQKKKKTNKKKPYLPSFFFKIILFYY